MPTNSMLSIRPDYEPVTTYGASWQTQILTAANSAGLPFIDLYKEQATASNFFSTIQSQDPLLVNIFGHGWYNGIVCQNGELLLEGGTNDDALAGRVVFDLSCQAGRDLGPSAVNKGAVSFLGYNEDFTFVITDTPENRANPLLDESARGFFESHNAAPISYIRGNALGNSYYASQDTFDYWIKVWEAIDSEVASILLYDKDHQVMIPLIPPKIETKSNLPIIACFIPLAILTLKNGNRRRI